MVELAKLSSKEKRVCCVPGIRDLATIKCGIQKTSTGYDIRLLSGKRDSPKFGHGCRIWKENDIRDNDDGSSGCEIPVKASGIGTPSHPFISHNEPLYRKVLGITNDFLYSSYSKIYGKEPRCNETLL